MSCNRIYETEEEKEMKLIRQFNMIVEGNSELTQIFTEQLQAWNDGNKSSMGDRQDCYSDLVQNRITKKQYKNLKNRIIINEIIRQIDLSYGKDEIVSGICSGNYFEVDLPVIERVCLRSPIINRKFYLYEVDKQQKLFSELTGFSQKTILERFEHCKEQIQIEQCQMSMDILNSIGSQYLQTETGFWQLWGQSIKGYETTAKTWLEFREYYKGLMKSQPKECEGCKKYGSECPICMDPALL